MADENKPRPREIRLRGIPNKMQTDLKNIAANLGTSISDLTKPKLWELINGYPDEMKQPPLKD